MDDDDDDDVGVCDDGCLQVSDEDDGGDKGTDKPWLPEPDEDDGAVCWNEIILEEELKRR